MRPLLKSLFIFWSSTMWATESRVITSMAAHLSARQIARVSRSRRRRRGVDRVKQF